MEHPDGTRSLVRPAVAQPANRRMTGRLLDILARGLRCGRVLLEMPDGIRFSLAAPSESGDADQVVLQVRDGAMVRKVLSGGALGFAESYMDGDWDSPDLAALLTLLARNQDALRARARGWWPVRLLHRIAHLRRANTRAGSRRNIAAHYDLGNRFYALWLDQTMTYSAARFRDAAHDLQAAQRHKLDALCRRLDLRPGRRVLEIGCGWGSFAEMAAAEYGCTVVAITLSEEQAAYARARMARAGLSDAVEVRLQDYRDVTETFDAIASIEMFEAVGESNWPTYFDVLRGRLAPGGRAGLQIITIADERFPAYRRSADFIQRYVFPGGMLPCPSVLERRIAQAGLDLLETEAFGACYAETLSRWQRRFQAAWPDIAVQGFDDRFKRLWEFYLAYCEAGFRVGSIDVCQMTLQRPAGPS